MTTETIDRLQAEREQAQAELEAAERALGEAMLAALEPGGRNVPGKLKEAADAARERVALLGHAEAAAERAVVGKSSADHAARRERRLAQIQQALDAFAAACAEIDEGLALIARENAAPRAAAALSVLRDLATDAQDRVLTPKGWHLAETLAEVRAGPGRLHGIAAEALANAFRGEFTPPAAGVLSAVYQKHLVADLAVQSPDWPHHEV